MYLPHEMYLIILILNTIFLSVYSYETYSVEEVIGTSTACLEIQHIYRRHYINKKASGYLACEGAEVSGKLTE
jgi:hypothetical protein